MLLLCWLTIGHELNFILGFLHNKCTFLCSCLMFMLSLSYYTFQTILEHNCTISELKKVE